LIRSVELHTFIFQGYEAKRRVASFGYDYSFTNRQLTKGKPIPHEFDFLIRRVAAHLNILQENFVELLLTEYPVGSVINWHRDAPPFDVIAGISLAADCIFKLRPHRKEDQNRKSIINLPVARRSLYVIAGASRSEWQHSTAPVTEVRYSITLRTVREPKS
jgi:alkylated DNA repair dioxygenase AlkB